MVLVAAGTTEDDVTGQPSVRALDARTGRRVWRSYVGPPLQQPAADGVVYVSDAKSPLAATGRIAGTVQAIAAATGRTGWSHGLDAGVADIAVDQARFTRLTSTGACTPCGREAGIAEEPQAVLK